jgi:hypothetical protein
MASPPGPPAAGSLTTTEIQQLGLASLDVTIPVQLYAEQSLEQPALRSILEKVCAVLGIPYSDRFGDYLLGRMIDEYDFNHDGNISFDELVAFIQDMKRAPRRTTRNPRNVLVLGGGAFGTGMSCVLARKGHKVSTSSFC